MHPYSITIEVSEKDIKRILSEHFKCEEKDIAFIYHKEKYSPNAEEYIPSYISAEVYKKVIHLNNL